MDYIEAATEVFLRSLGHSCIQFEPYGRDTFPDFLVADEMLVEVTELNKTLVRPGEKAINVTAKQRQMERTLQSAIHDFKGTDYENSTFVSSTIEGLPSKSEVQNAVRTLLKDRDGQRTTAEERKAANRVLSLSFDQGAKDYGPKYRLGGWSPPYSAGWLVPELLQQTNEAFTRKSKRLPSLDRSFQQCWLAVSGGASIAMDDDDFEEIKLLLPIPEPWNGVIFVDVKHPECSRYIGDLTLA